jgi:cell division protein FtsB
MGAARQPRRARRGATSQRRVRHARRGATIRWDRVGRVALLLVLGVILLLYISPVSRLVSQSRSAEQHRAELEALEQEHQELKRRAEDLSGADAVEREARRLGMVRRGERAIVVEGLPEGP